MPAELSDRAGLAGLGALLPRGAVLLATPLRRTSETLAALLPEGGPPEIEADLAEQDFGEWQGLTWDAVAARDAEGSARFWADPAGAAPPGGESFDTLAARVGRALERLSLAHAGRDLVAVCHAGTIRAALAHALGVEPRRALAFAVDAPSLTRLDRIATPDGPAWRVGGVNLAGVNLRAGRPAAQP